jgi:5-oxopent-3-ene-1,2,5-tricarboxylate decarboxylase / 2-hydroxyhepta-2,4-diene-1,7-dioate isomerase
MASPSTLEPAQAHAAACRFQARPEQVVPPISQGLVSRLSGTVIGALLNDPAQLAALGESVNQPPHKAPPRLPVLEVKPRHTWARTGQAIELPREPGCVLVGASLGIVIAQSACRVPAAEALRCVAGFVAVADLSLPLQGHYRPAARLKARDGFCVFGQTMCSAQAIADPDALGSQVLVDGRLVQAASTAGRVRGVAQLIADVSSFMSLQPGDVLLLGLSQGAPLARIGQEVCVGFDGLAGPTFTLVAEAEQVPECSRDHGA